MIIYFDFSLTFQKEIVNSLTTCLFEAGVRSSVGRALDF